MVYNKRRSGELEVITLQSYAARKKDLSDLDESITEDLTEVEKYLLKSQELITVRGKGGRPVPVIIPPDAKTALEYVASKSIREAANISPRNKYLFANTALKYSRAYDNLKEACFSCKLKSPQRITSVAMRKYTATLSQLMNLDKYQMEWVCRHLGHTKPVHKEAYRQMSGLIEKVYVTKLMMVQDLNLTGKYKGQSLQDINLNGEAQALIAKAKAQAVSIQTVATALSQQNGMNAVSLKIAEQYVNAFGNLAKTSNTVLLPANTGDISNMVASAMSIYKNVSAADKTGTTDGEPVDVNKLEQELLNISKSFTDSDKNMTSGDNKSKS